MGARFRLIQLELSPAGHDLQPVIDKRLENLCKVHRARTVVIDDQQLAAEYALHLRMRIKLIQNDGSHGAALDLNHNPDAGAQTCFVTQIGNSGDLLVLDQFRNLLDHH